MADVDGICRYMNRALADALGYLPREMLGRPMNHLVEPALREDFGTAFAGFVSGEAPLEGEWPLAGRHGRKGLFLSNPVILGEKGGQAKGAGFMVMLSGLQEAPEEVQVSGELQKNRKLLERAQEIAHLGVWEWDSATDEVWASDEVYRIVGKKRTGAAPDLEFFLDAVWPEDRQEVREGLREALSQGWLYEGEFRLRRPEGGAGVVRLMAEPLDNPDGPHPNLLGVVQDITGLWKVESQLDLAAQVLDNSIEAVFITDQSGKILTVNRAFTKITGYTPEEAVGRTPRILRSDRHGKDFYQEMWRALGEKGRWQGEIWNRRKNGEAYLEWQSITRVTDSRGKVQRFAAIFHDITEVRRGQEALHHQAYHDALTGLPNRKLFVDRLEMAITKVAQEGGHLAVAMMDLDNFKRVNDSLGLPLGDQVLEQAAQRMAHLADSDATVARLGGDEFLALFWGQEGMEEVVERARNLPRILEEPFRLEGRTVFLTASLGVAIYPSDGTDAVGLIKSADTALNQAKERGKNTYQLFEPSLGELVNERLRLEDELRQGMDREELVVHYQPKVRLADGSLAGLEALVRWDKPGEGLMPPVLFVPLAEETGLINQIGRWVLERAATDVRQWRNWGVGGLKVAVNLSARQFLEDDLVRVVREILGRTGLAPDGLELEVTESLVMVDINSSVATLRALKKMGVMLTMDDFGTGYSSLSYLKRLPLDSLKIDKSFVREVPDDPEDVAIVSTIVSMAHNLGLKVIAEGVENRRQLEFLRGLSCDEVQGYLYCRPLPAASITPLLYSPPELWVMGEGS